MKAVKFFNEVKQEIQKVTWLSRKETLISTGIVVLVVSVFSIVFVLFDWAIFSLIKMFLKIGV